jgi:hypothetical protein
MSNDKLPGDLDKVSEIRGFGEEISPVPNSGEILTKFDLFLSIEFQ